MFKDLTPEERSAAAHKAAETRRLNASKSLEPKPCGTWNQVPVFSLKLVRESTTPADSIALRSPADAAAVFARFMENLPQEHMVVMLLDARMKVIGINTVYVGSIHTTVIRVGEVFRPAILGNAVSIIVAHNHPSGDPTPSPEDVAVTRQFIQAGKLLDIEVLDHIVIGCGRFVSLKERNLAFNS